MNIDSINQRTSEFINITAQLATLCTQCELLPDIKEDILFPIKGDQAIHKILKKCSSRLKTLSNNHELTKITEQMDEWLDHFEKTYDEKSRLISRKPFGITKKDGERFSGDLNKWIDVISRNTLTPNTVLIKETSFDKFIPSRYLSGLQKEIREDLKEGFNLLLLNSSTSASIILLRAAEGIIRSFDDTKNDSDLNDLINDLEVTKKIKKSLSNYLHYIRVKRNEAAHTGKRFRQEEAEEILIHVKALLKELKEK